MAKKKTAKKKQKKTEVKSTTAEAKPTIEGPKPEFEEALKAAAGTPQGTTEPESKPQKDGRGGARPGAGRPRGVTDDFAAVNKLPEKANLTLVPVLQIPFELWAKGQQTPELALSKDEATELALPVTQLLEFYFPGKIPEIAWVWLMMLGTTSNILKPRMEILAKKRKQKREVSSVTAGGKGPAYPSSGSASPSGPVQPATGYPQEANDKK